MKDNLAAGPSCPESRTSHESRTWEGGSQRSRVIIAGGGGWLLLLLMPTAPHLETILGLVLKTVSYIEFSQEDSLARMLFGYSLLSVVVETALLMAISVSTDSFPSCSSVTMVNW